MAHMVDRMMYAGKVPWHGLGIALPNVCDSDTLRQLVFDWHVDEHNVYVRDSRIPASEYKALTRSDTGALLAIMPATYGVVEYADALALLDAASEQGDTRYVTAGTLDGGRRAWALATIPSCTYNIAGAELKPYLLLSTAHDGSRALRILFTGVYVVCNNTETAALAEAGVSVGRAGDRRTKRLPNVLTVRHTKNAAARVQQAAGVIASAREYFGRFNQAALSLAARRYSTFEMATLAATLFPPNDTETRATNAAEAAKAASAQTRRLLLDLFEGKQRARLCAPGTRWSAYNAVTELVDHHATRRGKTAEVLAERRFEGSLFGSGLQIKQRAMDMLLAA